MAVASAWRHDDGRWPASAILRLVVVVLACAPGVSASVARGGLRAKSQASSKRQMEPLVDEDMTQALQVDELQRIIANNGDSFIIASFPQEGQIMYMRMPDPTWRPLVAGGLALPRAIAIDDVRSRLFVADEGNSKVYWYQLSMLDPKTLVTDGRQYDAAVGIIPRDIGVDKEGHLYIAGVTTPPPPDVGVDGLFRQESTAFATVAPAPTPPAAAKMIWAKDDMGVQAQAIALDQTSVYFGARANGLAHGCLGRGKQNPQAPAPRAGITQQTQLPKPSVTKMADNVDLVYDMVVTPNVVFYSSEHAIYSVPRANAGANCNATGACALVSANCTKITGMVWDGDGTVFVADNTLGEIREFASATGGAHSLQLVNTAPHIWDLDIFTVPPEEVDTGDSWWFWR